MGDSVTGVHVLGDDVSGHISRVNAAPTIGHLERAPTGEHGANLSLQAPQWSALAAETWNVMPDLVLAVETSTSPEKYQSAPSPAAIV
jgi:hypothetical protein